MTCIADPEVNLGLVRIEPGSKSSKEALDQIVTGIIIGVARSVHEVRAVPESAAIGSWPPPFTEEIPYLTPNLDRRLFLGVRRIGIRRLALDRRRSGRGGD